MTNVNQWMVFSLLFLPILVIGAAMDKFEWQATESGPRNYPMQIVTGDLYYHDGSGSLYVPNKATLDHGWGTMRSSHIVGPDFKPLPNRLEITFFSYTENQFYVGKFNLPYEKILAMFKEGYDAPRRGHITYRQIIVGVAPGGAVSVWLSGISKTTEVYFGQAEKADIDWRRINDNPKYSREEYVRLEIQDSLKTPEALESLKKNGVPVGLWSSYRTRYSWQPVFNGMSIRDRLVSLYYFNGEEDFLYTPLKPDIAAATRPIPRELRFTWEQTKIKGRAFELSFDEAEIFDVFKKLGGNGRAVQLEMRMQPLENNKLGFTVWLKNDKDAIELQRAQTKTFGVDDRKVEGAR